MKYHEFQVSSYQFDGPTVLIMLSYLQLWNNYFIIKSEKIMEDYREQRNWNFSQRVFTFNNFEQSFLSSMSFYSVFVKKSCRQNVPHRKDTSAALLDVRKGLNQKYRWGWLAHKSFIQRGNHSIKSNIEFFMIWKTLQLCITQTFWKKSSLTFLAWREVSWCSQLQ